MSETDNHDLWRAEHAPRPHDPTAPHIPNPFRMLYQGHIYSWDGRNWVTEPLTPEASSTS